MTPDTVAQCITHSRNKCPNHAFALLALHNASVCIPVLVQKTCSPRARIARQCAQRACQSSLILPCLSHTHSFCAARSLSPSLLLDGASYALHSALPCAPVHSHMSSLDRVTAHLWTALKTGAQQPYTPGTPDQTRPPRTLLATRCDNVRVSGTLVYAIGAAQWRDGSRQSRPDTTACSVGANCPCA